MSETKEEDDVSTLVDSEATEHPSACLIKQVFSLEENDLAAIHGPSNKDLKTALGRFERQRPEETTDV